ncbi:MAG: hypothetical protein AB8F78_14435 [Saprospiraceae bacterium]
MMLRCTFLFSLLFYVTSLAAQRQQPFEGVITYLVKTELKDKDNPYNKFYAQRFGDTLKVYYHKNGSERTEFNNTGQLGTEWNIYNKINNEQYTKYNNIDSVFYGSSADTISRLDTLIGGDTLTILGKHCESLQIKSTNIFSGEIYRKTFYFSGEEHSPPHTYTQRKAEHLDKLYAESKSRFLRWEIDQKYIYATFEAISIEQIKVDPNLFIVPRGVTKIKM